MLCDLMVMADDGYIKLAFSDIALIPDCGANWLLPQALGYRRAYQMAIEARSLDAKFCLQHGLANKIAPTDSALEEMGNQLSEKVDPFDDLHASAAQRKHLVGVLAKRALQKAADMALQNLQGKK